VAVALACALFAFLYRFNALGGANGGFDDEEFATLTRVDLLLAGEQPLRDFADGELRAVWPSLTFELPTAAQRLFGATLLTHAWFTFGVLALCAAAVFLLARTVSRSWLASLLATGMVITSGVKAYNYPKVVVLVVAAVILRSLAAGATPTRLAVAAFWTVAAGLFRHDYAVYVAVGVVACLALAPAGRHRGRGLVRGLAIYVACGAALALPSLLWVARYEGLVRYAGTLLDYVTAEGRRLEEWPVLDPASPLSTDSLIALNYYLFWALPLAGVVVLAGCWRRSAASSPEGARHIRLGVALVCVVLLVDYFFLRANLQGRFGDASAAVAVLGAWLAGAALLFGRPIERWLGFTAAVVVLAVMLVAFVRVNSLRHELETGGLTVSPAAAGQRFTQVSDTLRELPPTTWQDRPTEGALAIARYLAVCTRPTDRVLMGIYEDAIPYYARRLFAGGQPFFAFGFFRSERAQRQTLERLQRQSVPVVVTAADYEREIAANYPLVAAYIAEHYREVGLVRAEGAPYARVFVESSRAVSGVDAVLGYPCFAS
jgi:hypothetical protein